jgi:mannosyltransferase
VEVAGKSITKYGVALLAIVLIGLFLRVYQLGTQSTWYDEAWSVWLSRMSVPQIVDIAARFDSHPPLYYFILHYWISLFGTSDFAVRLLSAVFGVLAIPMIYVVGRQLFNKEVGLLSALILALSSFNIWFSQETRMYSLMVLFALLSMYFFLRLLQRNSLAMSAGYLISTTLLVYTHYYGSFVVIAQNVYIVTLLVLSKHRTYKLRDWVILQAIVLALFVPWMADVIIQNRPSEGSVVQTVTLALIVHTFATYSGGTVMLALFLVLSVLSLFAYQKVRGTIEWKAPLKSLESYLWQVRIQDTAPVYFLAAWLITVNLIPIIISLFTPPIYGEPKYTIAASVALYLLVAKGTSNINHRPIKLAVIGIVVVLSVANFPGYYFVSTRPQAREATSLIDANFKSGDVVLVYPDWQLLPFNYYNNRTDIAAKPIHAWAADKPTNLLSILSTNRSLDKMQELQSAVNGHNRVWFLNPTYEYGTSQNLVLGVLNESYAKSYVKSYYGYDAYLYEKRS